MWPRHRQPRARAGGSLAGLGLHDGGKTEAPSPAVWRTRLGGLHEGQGKLLPTQVAATQPLTLPGRKHPSPTPDWGEGPMGEQTGAQKVPEMLAAQQGPE